MAPSRITWSDVSRLPDDGIRGAPDIVVEILSPATAERDRGVKRKLYDRLPVRLAGERVGEVDLRRVFRPAG